jgi:hypothetical protein
MGKSITRLQLIILLKIPNIFENFNFFLDLRFYVRCPIGGGQEERRRQQLDRLGHPRRHDVVPSL